MQIELSQADYEGLLLALAIAHGAMIATRNDRLAYRILELTNTVGKGNPDFRPYSIPEEYRHG